MIDPFHSISMLAADDGKDTIIQFGLFVVLAIGSLIGALIKKSGEKRQQEQTRRQAEEAKDILARRTQREQSQQMGTPQKAGFPKTIKKATALRDFIRSYADSAPPPPPPPRPQPKPSMFAAAPKPVPVEQKHRMIELTPIEHLPPEDELIHSVMPSEEGHERKKSVAEFLRRRTKPASVIAKPTEPQSESELHLASEPMESNVHTRVNLLDDKTARAAIIFHEILSPPKALRNNVELWE